MNIVQIIPGSGGSFYCGNCLRDSKFYEAMKKLDHQIIKIPMYLPLFSDEHDLGDIPVFYGAVSVYLKQQYKFLRNLPDWVYRLFDSKPMLRLAARMSGSTDAQGLEDMTISMLMGENGVQADDLDKMVYWIKEHCKPDIVHLSNALLLGLAPRLKEVLGIPVICSLQDEDVWVDAMDEIHQEKVWSLMSKKAMHVDHFIAVSDFYSKIGLKRLKIAPEKMSTIHLGVDPDEYVYQNTNNRPLNIGYISRTCPENGYEVLIKAFILLKEKKQFSDVNLHVTGGSTGADNKFLKKIANRIKEAGIENYIIHYDEFEGDARHGFFKEISIVSVPVLKGEAFGIYLTEAMACGIPIVQPALGAFPEIIAQSNGGLVYDNNTPEELCNAWMELLSDGDKLSRLSENARKSCEGHFNINTLATRLVKSYEQVK